MYRNMNAILGIFDIHKEENAQCKEPFTEAEEL